MNFWPFSYFYRNAEKSEKGKQEKREKREKREKQEEKKIKTEENMDTLYGEEIDIDTIIHKMFENKKLKYQTIQSWYTINKWLYLYGVYGSTAIELTYTLKVEFVKTTHMYIIYYVDPYKSFISYYDCLRKILYTNNLNEMYSFGIHNTSIKSLNSYQKNI